jgi:hypothetical protein
MTDQERYPYLVLNLVMQDSYRRRVIGRALEHRAKASPETRKALNAMLRTYVRRIGGGFRSVERAPAFVLVDGTNQAFQASNQVVYTVLSAWMEAQEPLAADVRAFLEAEAIAYPAEPLPADGFPGEWSAARMLELADKFLATHPGADKDDTALMLCCVTGNAPVGE